MAVAIVDSGIVISLRGEGSLCGKMVVSMMGCGVMVSRMGRVHTHLRTWNIVVSGLIISITDMGKSIGRMGNVTLEISKMVSSTGKVTTSGLMDQATRETFQILCSKEKASTEAKIT